MTESDEDYTDSMAKAIAVRPASAAAATTARAKNTTAPPAAMSAFLSRSEKTRLNQDGTGGFALVICACAADMCVCSCQGERPQAPFEG